jgi:pimeloyl-ACP methyl ester carboxylesterase
MNLIAQVKQGPIEYRQAGQGQPVLVLNGGHTHCDSPLGHEAFFLARGCQLLVPSRPGYGRTPASTGKTAEDFAEALVSLLDALGLRQCILVGISAGGPTALQLAGRHPERVSRLILQNAVTGGIFPTRAIRLGAYLLFNPWVEGGTWALFRAFARAAPHAALRAMLGSLTTLDPAQVLASMSPAQQQAALGMLLASRSGSGFLHDLHHRCGDLSRITAPTLIIRSRYDGSLDAFHAHYAADNIPNAELFISPAESHLLWFSRHNDAVETKMRVFLSA